MAVGVNFNDISIHALLAESDPAVIKNRTAFSVFLSTLSLRRATNVACGDRHKLRISIHALLAESDVPIPPNLRTTALFLSTLSLRRATCDLHPLGDGLNNFYPRSPCGERPRFGCLKQRGINISIHALLAESDGLP